MHQTQLAMRNRAGPAAARKAVRQTDKGNRQSQGKKARQGSPGSANAAERFQAAASARQETVKEREEGRKARACARALRKDAIATDGPTE